MIKSFWKTLGAVTLAAAVIPVRIKKDELTGKKTFQSLLWKLDVEPGEHDNTKTKIGLELMEGVLTAPLTKAITAKKESVLFADDEPEAAVVEAATEMAEAAAEEAEVKAEEVESRAEVPESKEVAEADFDPEF